MRKILLVILIFLIQANILLTPALAQEQKMQEVIEVDTQSEGNDEAALKKKAFEDALAIASQKILLKYVQDNQKYLVARIVEQTDIKKFFNKAEVVSAISNPKDGGGVVFNAIFRITFDINDIKKLITDNGLTFQESLAKRYKVLQVPLFLDGEKLYYWHDTAFANAFLFNAQEINNYSIFLIEPELFNISQDLNSIPSMHAFAAKVQQQNNFDGYNLILCTVQKQELSCNNHLILSGFNRTENIKVTTTDPSFASQLVSEINSIYVGNKDATSSDSATDKANTEGNTYAANELYVQFSYGELPELLRFQKLLTENPHISYYKISESNFGMTKFFLQVKDSIDEMKEWFSSYEVIVGSFDPNTNTLFLHLAPATP